MTNKAYLHITEAVETYGKTRQTFYNYINKGLVRTKKVNNKVYLHQGDIQQLLDGYIPDAIEPQQIQKTSEAEESFYDEDIIEASDIASPTPSTPPQDTAYTNITKDLSRLYDQNYTIQDAIIDQIKFSKQDMLYDLKQTTQSLQQNIVHTQDKHMQDIDQHFSSTTTLQHKQSLMTKKVLFWLGYTSILVIHLYVSSYYFS